MIQFSIQKGICKKGNQIAMENQEGLFDNLSHIFEFIKKHSNRELEDKLDESIELIPFKDGTVYVLNSIGRSELITEEQINDIKERTNYEKLFSSAKSKKSSLLYIEALKTQVFNLYVVDTPEDLLSYEVVADLDKHQLVIYRKGSFRFSIPFTVIREEDAETLCYHWYNKYLSFPIYQIECSTEVAK